MTQGKCPYEYPHKSLSTQIFMSTINDKALRAPLTHHWLGGRITPPPSELSQ